MNTEELGRSVRRKREQLSASLRDVANATGVSASTLSRIENGKDLPPGSTCPWSEFSAAGLKAKRPRQ